MKNFLNNSKKAIFLVLALVVALGVTSLSPVSADIEPSAETAVAVSLAKYLGNFPNAQLALLLGQYLVGKSQSLLPAGGEGQNIGAAQPLTRGVNEPTFDKICLKGTDDPRYCVFEGWETLEFPASAATTTISQKSAMAVNLDSDIFIDYVEVEGKGIVTSTFKTWAGVVSSSAWLGGVAYNAANSAIPNNLIDGVQFATSTTNIEYASGYRNVKTNQDDAGTNGLNGYRMSSSSVFVVFKQSAFGAVGTCGSGTGASYCTQVTSTSNMPDLRIRYHYHGRKAL